MMGVSESAVFCEGDLARDFRLMLQLLIAVRSWSIQTTESYSSQMHSKVPCTQLAIPEHSVPYSRD